VLGAVYGGFHYAVDMLAGVLFGVTAARVTLMVSRLDDGEPPKTPT
jgi:membrane-associated phospholipid phosphatase